MRGLLLKDIYTLIKQMKIFLLFMLVCSFIPDFSMAGFAIMYAVMLPISVLAYDERCKWDTLAGMMPYSAADLVFEKYLLGFLSAALSGLMIIIGQTIVSLFSGAIITAKDYQSVLLLLCAALILQAIILPLLFRFGVEKGRLLFIAVTVLFIVLIMSAKDALTDLFSSLHVDMLTVILMALLLAVIVSLISVMISSVIYRKREN